MVSGVYIHMGINTHSDELFTGHVELPSDHHIQQIQNGFYLLF